MRAAGNYYVLETQQEIEKCLTVSNELFIPKLSDRKSSLSGYSEKLFKYARNIVIKNNEEIMGFLSFYINHETKVSYLTLICVKPEYQGEKNGEKLLKIYEMLSAKNQMRTLKLEVFYSNKKAIKFYEKNKFKFLNKISKDSCFMYKTL